jgi:hypothetical protein
LDNLTEGLTRDAPTLVTMKLKIINLANEKITAFSKRNFGILHSAAKI